MSVLVPWLAVCAAGYGALAGSLLPRAVHRLAVPPGTPWRGQCPAGHEFAGPARGWLGRARCRVCASSVGVPAVDGTRGTGEAGQEPPEPAGPPAGPWPGTSTRFFITTCAAVCAALALSAGVRPELAVWLLAAPVGLLLTAVDARVQRLPDVLTLPLAAAMAAALGLAALAPGAGGDWTGALLGGAALTGGFFVLFLISPRGMGFGDVKLAATPGLALGWYGWDVLFAGTLLAFLLAAAYGLTLLLAKRAKWKSSVPFGPFLLLGSLGGLLLGGLAA